MRIVTVIVTCTILPSALNGSQLDTMLAEVRSCEESSAAVLLTETVFA